MKRWQSLLALLAVIVPLAAVPASAAKPKPVYELENDWVPSYNGSDQLGKTTTMFVALDHQTYQVVPEMVVVLYLPKGVHILGQKTNWGGYIKGTGPSPVKNARFARTAAGRPEWIVRDVVNIPEAVWVFTMNTPAGAKQVCVTATARPVGVPGGMTQKGTGCKPGQE